MKLLQNTSIRQRLTYIIMSISCVSVLITTLAISVIGIYSLRSNIIDELIVSASIVGSRNNAALSFDTYDQAESNLAVFSVKQTIVQACLYDRESQFGEIINKLVARYANTAYRNTSECPTDLSERVITGDIGRDLIQLMRPVLDEAGNTIGYIYIESTQEDINNYIRKQASIALSVSLAALIISYLLAINFQRTISDPILGLADTARQFSIDKDYTIRAPIIGDPLTDGRNELVTLTGAFNNMLEEINARNVELRKQYKELEKAKDAAEAANRAKSNFLANISHELRTPLNAIIGFSSILMNQLFGPLGDQKYIEYSKDINESGTHLLEIINDILDLSKAESGKLALNYEEVHVGKAINKCLTIIAERAQKAQIAITSDVPKMLPSLVADRVRLIQIFLNIVSNAVKFTGAGGSVNLTVRTEETDTGGIMFNISIKDTGIGMTKEDIEKAFQSFGQVDSGLNRKYEGTGLGLPLTKKL
ncbi:MAG: ATP-binding protein, partial [Rickettsiales bacterium]|nr:ATP-binding protein [Rickettsiales bacterium]